MRYLKILIDCLLFVFIRIISDSSVLALFIFILNIVFIIHKNPYIDKDYISFIKKANNYKNIEEALKSKKYHFSKQNQALIESYQKIVTNEKDYKRFISIQNERNKMFINAFNSRLVSYIINSLIPLSALVSFIVIKNNNIFYYYYLYNNGYLYLLILITFVVLSNIYNMYLMDKELKVDTKNIDDYSLCFHKNVLNILKIENSELTFNDKGYINKINTSSKINVKFCYYNLINLLLGILVLMGFIK